MSIDLKKLRPSASMEITRITKELKDAGNEVYAFSIGDTHFDPPAKIMEGLSSMSKSASHYGLAQGILELRHAICKQHDSYEPSEVIIVPGLKQGFYYALEALEKKTMAVLEPAWLGYHATSVLSGYDYLPVNTYAADWLSKLDSLDFDVLMACVPNNPDGGILAANEAKRIMEIARRKKAWIMLDTIYDHYSYDADAHEILELFNCYDKLIIGNGFSKSHAMTGFRVGYLLVKDKQVMSNMIKIQQNMATCASSFTQDLLAQNTYPKEIDYYQEYYSENRDIVLKVFPEWKPFRPDGGFYYFVDLGIYGIENAASFCTYALKNAGVAMVPGTAYGSGFENFIRLSFSIERNALEKGLKKLKELIYKMNAKTNS